MKIYKLILATIIAAALGVSLPACGQKAPPNLTPQATASWHGTRAIKALDTVRDIAISANEQQPPLMSTDDTRKVVLYHRSTITVIHAAPNGWQATASTGLDELLKGLPEKDQVLLGPYVELVKVILKEVP